MDAKTQLGVHNLDENYRYHSLVGSLVSRQSLASDKWVELAPTANDDSDWIVGS